MSIGQVIEIVLKTLFGTGLLFALWQLYFVHRKYLEDFELSRRAKAVDFIIAWTRSLTVKSTAARKFAEALSDEQTQKLFQNEPFSVPADRKKLLQAVFPDLKVAKSSKSVELSQEQVSDLRWQLVNYLNTLESILCAKRYKVADPQIIDEQFSYLVSPKEGHFVLEKLRRISGIEHFPGINDFVEAKRNHKVVPPPPADLGKFFSRLSGRTEK